MDKRYSKKGLWILAPEVQGSSVADIETVINKHKVKYPIMKGTTRPEGMRGIPHSVVFDSTGEMVFQGHPMDEGFDKAIKKALREVKLEDPEEGAGLFAKPLFPERTWTNNEGKPLVASVISATDTTVKFKLKNGRQVDYPIEKLSEEDQKFIKDNAATEDDEE